MTVSLPSNFSLRQYQTPVWQYFAGGGRRAVSVWHRRAGKDLTAIHRTAVESHKRIGTYWHMLPQQNQARKVIWDGIVYDQYKKPQKIIDWAFPEAIREKTNVQEMKITLKCGSIWQLCGSDNYDSLVGSNPAGLIMSEYSVSKPSAWEYIRPILTENGGWAWFIYTPRGMNHGKTLFDMATENPDWFAEILTVRETQAITENAIQGERNSGMSEDMVDQEFYCSFEAAMVGAYYGKLMVEAQAAGRIRDVPHDPALPVHTSWDIGVHDHTSIWLWQVLPGGETHAFDYIEGTGQGIDYYLGLLAAPERAKYSYGTDYVPHDFKGRSFAANAKSPYMIAEAHGRRMEVIPKMDPTQRVTASRVLIPKTYFDQVKCKLGLDALRNYSRKWDPERRSFLNTPDHDWASHPADSFGHFAVGYQPKVKFRMPGAVGQRSNVHSGSWMGG